MTYYHPLWAPPDDKELAAGQAAVDRAVAAAKQDGREKAFVRAIQAYYKGLDAPELAAGSAPAASSCHAGLTVDLKGRAACFNREMTKVATDFPDDVDAAAFYALSLVATAPPGDPKLANQAKAATVLENWYGKLPDHPGLAHYLIHSYDYPSTAQKGLKAARDYSEIAPWVPHALHMPSHIFTRLGMWDETIRGNLASAEASRRSAALHHPDATDSQGLHALDYCVYGYLQTGQDAKAKEVVEKLKGIKKTFPELDFAAGYALGAMPARYALERRQWKEAAALEVPTLALFEKLQFAEGHLIYARAIGSVKTGDLARARAAVDRLGELSKLSTDPRYRYFADQMNIQRQAALGLIAIAEGKKDEGMATLAAAAGLEDSLGKHPVSPGAMLPVRELYAEALLDAGKPAEALTQFEASLKIYPARFNGLYGAARAAEKADQRATAKEYFRQLVDLAKPGDGNRAALSEAKEQLAKL